ncbi:HIT family protein [Paenibacillus tarimensis]
MDNCIICQKHRNESKDLLFQGEHWKIYYGPYESQVAGYMYLEPDRHIENWSEFSTIELNEMTLLIQRSENILLELLKVERLYVVTISEAVRHLHLHLIPRLAEAELRGLPLIQSATQQNSEDTVVQQVDYVTLREELQKSFSKKR